jgi:hypothetical protein
MPRFLRFKCSLCDGARTGNRFVCWCPASYARAFRVVDQPPPAAHRVIQQVIVSEHFFPQSPAPMIAQIFGRGYAITTGHGGLVGLISGIEGQRLNASIDLRGGGEVEVSPNLLLSTLADARTIEDGWNHFAEDGFEHLPPELSS